MRANRTRDGACCPGRTRRGCATSSPPPARGASLRRPTARGGASRGPAGRRRRRSRSRRWPTGWPRPTISRTSPAPGCGGPRPTTAGSACCTANCSSACPDPASRLTGGAGLDGGAHVLRQAGRDLLVVRGEPFVLHVHPAQPGVHLGRAVVEVPGDLPAVLLGEIHRLRGVGGDAVPQGG